MIIEKTHLVNSVKGGAAVLDYIKTYNTHSMAAMSRHIGVSIPTVKKAIERFLDKGLLVEVKRGKTNRPSVFKVVE